jgi:hypothetical protein
MFLFDFLSKINAINSFFKLIKSLNKVLLIIIFAVIFISITGFFIIKKHYDNSIYIDTVQDERIKKEMQNIIKKCGNKYAIGLSTISTETNSNYYGKFKEFWTCNENLNQECLMMDLTLQEKYRTDYNIDSDSYELFKNIAIEDEIKKLDLQTFNIRKYSAIYDVLTLSPNFKNINTLWFSCVINNEKKVIYVISMTTWGDRDCPDAILYLTKLKQKLPISKLWK